MAFADQKPESSVPIAAGRGAGAVRLFAALREIAPTVAVVGLFAVAVLAIGAALGLPLVPPTERVSMVTGFHSAIPLGVGIATYLLGQRLRRFSGSRQRSTIEHDIRLDTTILVLFVLAFYFHFNLKMWIPLINGALYDDVYYELDNKIKGVELLFIYIRTQISFGSMVVDTSYQFAFYVSFIISFAYYTAVNRRFLKNYSFAVLAMLCFGGLSYLIAPALGPFIFEEGVNAVATEAQLAMWGAYQELQAEGPDWLVRYGSAYFTGALAAMPSLHIGHGAVNLYYIARSRSKLLPLFGLLFFWITIESVASKWHYVVDLPAGLLLAAAIIWMADRLYRVGDRAAPRTP